MGTMFRDVMDSLNDVSINIQIRQFVLLSVTEITGFSESRLPILFVKVFHLIINILNINEFGDLT